MTPRVSVLICTRNRERYLAGALNALAAQRTRPQIAWEVVVVDNASTDGTKALVERFRAGTPLPVCYIHHEPLGHSRALNRGIAACSGQAVAFTDDDALPAPDWLQQLTEAMDRFKADWVFGRVEPRWEGEEPPWFSRRFMGAFALLDYGPLPFVVAEARHSFYGVNCAARREVLERLGGFREDFGPKGNTGGVGADIDLFERSLAAGHKIVYEPKMRVEHVIPASRAEKAWHRDRIRGGAADYYQFLCESAAQVPWLLGLPRYFYRKALSDAVAFARHTLRGDQSEAFFRELQLWRFISLGYQATRRRRAPEVVR